MRKKILAFIAGAAILTGCRDLPTSPPSQGGVDESLGGSGYGMGASPANLDTLIKQVAHSTTADLNGDGFVTLDEVVAMKQAGLNDDELIERLRATNQAYELTSAQENYLRSQGISDYVIEQMEVLNRTQRDVQLKSFSGGGSANPPGAVISVPLPEESPALPKPSLLQSPFNGAQP